MRRSLGGWKALGVLAIAMLLLMAPLSLPRVNVADEQAVPPSVKSAPSTHKPERVITVANTEAGEKLEDFCIDAKGRILALLGPADATDGVLILGEDGTVAPAPQPSGNKRPKFASAVHVYAADGKLLDKWPVGFSGQAINTAPDGTILVGGDGRVARFDAQGKKLHEAESPQMTYIDKNPEEMRERAKEQLESDKVLYAEQVKQFEEQLAELKKTKSKEPEKSEKKRAKRDEASEEEDLEQDSEAQITQILQSFKQHLKHLQTQTIESVLEQVTARAKRTHSITASDKDVFVSCPAMAGYGFAIWRTDEKFGQAKEIVKSLSGCCGQMDVQCCEGEVYVCENSRHRVVRFDREGKELSQFGKRDRTGEGEHFGSCCNPMNLCFNKQGNLYVSESNGVVKHFTRTGEYLGIVGVADVQPGCKNSCVGVTADDSRLFYIDVYKSKIIVLARNEAVGKK